MRKTIIALITIFLFSGAVLAQDKEFISEWLVMGTFQNNQVELLLNTDYLNGEKTVTPSQGDIFTGREWKKERILEAGNINFNQMNFEINEQCVVYVHNYVYSEKEQNIAVHIGSDDGVSMFVNGKLVHYNMTWRGWGADQDKVFARIGKGWNRFLFKVFNGSGGFDFSARITDQSDNKIPGLRYELDNPYKDQTFITPDVESWIIVEEANLASNLVRKGKNYFYPINLFIKNIGTRDVNDLYVSLNGTDVTGNTLFSKREKIKIPDSGPYSIFLNEKDISKLLSSKSKLDIEITWADKSETSSLEFNNDIFLNTLFTSDMHNLPENITEKIEYLDLNLKWARFFLENKFSIEDNFTVNLADNFFNNKWKNADKNLDTLIEKVKTASRSLKENTIHFAGNAHIDMAWLWKFEETVQVSYETFASALNFADMDDEFVYSQSQAQAYWWIENRFPNMFKKIQEKVKNGQWEIVGGMWIEPDLNVPSGEALVRQILYGKRYFLDKFGVDVRIGYNPDSFGYNIMLPQIFKKAGIDFFITQKIGWNDTNKFPHRLFWWESPDGSRILTFFPHTYVHSAQTTETASQFKEFKEMSGSNDQLVLYGVGNHGGGPTQVHIDNIQKMKKIDAFPTVKESSTIDFMKLSNENAQKLDYPVYKDELYLEYHRGVQTTQADNKRSNRISEILLEEAEKFAVIADNEYPRDELNEAWRLTMFNQFHDILPGTSISEVYDDSDVQYAFVKSLGDRMINNALTETINKINYKSEGIPVVVFNPLSWERTEVTQVMPPEHYEDGMGLFDSDGNEIPYIVLEGQISFIAEKIPSVGYKTYYLRTGRNRSLTSEMKVTDNTIENSSLIVTLDPTTGNIISLFDKKNNREVLEPGKQGNVLELLDDRPSQWDAWNIGFNGEMWEVNDVKKMSVKSNSPLKASIRIEKEFSSSQYAQELILYKDSPVLDIVTSVDWDEHRKFLKAAFNLNVKNDVATYEIPYGTIQRATIPKNSFDEAKTEVAAQKWIDLTDRSGDYGVSLLNDSKYGFDIKESKMRISLLKAPKYPDPNADIGKHKFTYSLYPHKGGWREADTFRKAYQLNYPLIARTGGRNTGDMPEVLSYASTDQPEIIITVVKKSEDSDDIIVRFHETHGKQVNTTLKFNKSIVRVKETDLIERPLETLDFNGKEVTIPTKPYEIKTILVKFDSKSKSN